MDGRGEQDAITDIIKRKICDVFVVMGAAVNDDVDPLKRLSLCWVTIYSRMLARSPYFHVQRE
jgi:hypothetical protein